MRKKAITREEIEREYTNKPGVSITKACKALNVCYATFKKALEEHGVPVLMERKYGHHLGKIPQLRDAEWLRNELTTKNLAQITRELGTTHGNVYSAAVRLGVLVQSASKSEAIKESLRKRYPDGRRGELAANWRGGRRVAGDGYIAVYKPDHPWATKEGYVMEHRLVVEEKLGRILEPSEIVHHINGIKDDNRASNLDVLASKAEHVQHHWDVGDKIQELEGRIAFLEGAIQQLRDLGRFELP